MRSKVPLQQLPKETNKLTHLHSLVFGRHFLGQLLTQEIHDRDLAQQVTLKMIIKNKKAILEINEFIS